MNEILKKDINKLTENDVIELYNRGFIEVLGTFDFEGRATYDIVVFKLTIRDNYSEYSIMLDWYTHGMTSYLDETQCMYDNVKEVLKSIITQCTYRKVKTLIELIK